MSRVVKPWNAKSALQALEVAFGSGWECAVDRSSIEHNDWSFSVRREHVGIWSDSYEAPEDGLPKFLAACERAGIHINPKWTEVRG